MTVTKKSVLEWAKKELAKTQRNYDFSLKTNDTDRNENLAKNIGRWIYVIKALIAYKGV